MMSSLQVESTLLPADPVVAPSLPLLAAIDTFWIIVAIAIGTTIFDWLKRRGQSRDTKTSGGDSHPPAPSIGRSSAPHPSSAPAPAGTSNWEEELRRLLGGESIPAPPPPVAPPPLRPIIVSQAPPPVIVTHTPRPVPIAVTRPVGDEESEAPSYELARLEQSATAYHRASQLHETVSERLRHVDEMTERHVATVPAARRPVRSPEIAQVIAQFRNPRSARQAVLASIILGPPRALENP